jgi:hypothetical protein
MVVAQEKKRQAHEICNEISSGNKRGRKGVNGIYTWKHWQIGCFSKSDGIKYLNNDRFLAAFVCTKIYILIKKEIFF